MKPTAQTNSDSIRGTFDVIISGGGPVGLFLASELALRNCSVLILEKSPEQTSQIKQLPFGIRGLSAPSIEAFARRGLLGELAVHKRIKHPHAGGAEMPRRQVGHFAGIPFYEDRVDTTQWAHRLPVLPTNLISEIEEIETILTRRAASSGVVIQRASPVSAFEQSETAVVVHAGADTFHGKWLIGCDGARSAVRKAGGFEFAGTEPEFTGYSTRVDIADPDKLKPGRNITENGMYLQSQPGFLILQDFDRGAFHSSEKPITREHVQDVIRRISGTDVTISALHYATTWTDRARQATAYRNGRLLLAGDAAHIHSPLGGQGLNLGLGDAMNLGWKLAAAIQGRAPVGLLDTYQTERHPIGAQVLDWSRAQVAIMRPDPHARALNAIFRDLIDTTDGATYIAGRVWGIFTRYDLGDEHPLVGRSVPNFEFEDGRTIANRMQDGRGLLLDFTKSDSLKIASSSRDQIKWITGNVTDNLGLTAALIRPDGIVAWATNSEPDSRDLENAIARWFG